MAQIAVIGNNTQWCIASWEREILHNPKLVFVNDKVPFSGPGFFCRICSIHYSQKLNKRFNFPMHRIWYRNFAKTLKIDEDTEYVVVYDWSRVSRDFGFIRYLHRNFPKLKVLYLFSNVCRISGAEFYGILPELNDHYDRVFAFDKGDAKYYQFSYSPLMYMRSDTASVWMPSSDLFYIGQAKKRLEDIHAIYETAVKIGLSCDFHIVGVPKDKQKYPEGIHYNQPLLYDDVIRRIKDARCIVDVTQQNSHGLTIKVCEAVVFNKKLISTNPYISEETFYRPNRIFRVGQDQDLLHFMKEGMDQYTDKEISMFSFENMLTKFIHRKYPNEEN